MRPLSASLAAVLICSAVMVAPVPAAQLSLAPPPKPTVHPSEPRARSDAIATAPLRAIRRKAPDAQPPQPYVLDITIVTGDDDLRSDSIAWLSVPSLSDPLCKLRDQGGETWANGLSRTVTCSVLLRSLDDLKKYSSKLLYVGKPHDTFHSYDNWNVDEVRVAVRDPNGNGDQCIFDVAGTPLVRMTKQQEFPVGFDLHSNKFPC